MRLKPPLDHIWTPLRMLLRCSTSSRPCADRCMLSLLALTELSRTSNSLRGNPLDFTFVTEARQKMEAHKGLWELMFPPPRSKSGGCCSSASLLCREPRRKWMSGCSRRYPLPGPSLPKMLCCRRPCLSVSSSSSLCWPNSAAPHSNTNTGRSSSKTYQACCKVWSNVFWLWPTPATPLCWFLVLVWQESW